MKKLALFLLFVLLVTTLSAQQKYALVIGNGAYTSGRLANPVNDANDMTAALQSLGFTVDKVLDGNLDQIESAVMRLKNRLSVSKNSYGFFFYAGHGVQSNGVNYLIPIGAAIPSENSLRDRAVSVQWTLSELNDAGNELNIVVLDACRDNPFTWARSGSRGLAVISNQPADSIVVYATSAGSTAADGTGRNGLFTSELLKNIKTPGMEVNEIFRRTGAGVAQASDRKQIPALYSQFFGNAYLSSAPAAAPASTVQSSVATGNITVTSAIAGEILIDGKGTGISVKDGGTATITNVSTGNTEVAVKESNGAIIKAPQMVMVRQGQTVTAAIERAASAPAVQPAAVPVAPPVRVTAPEMVRISGGTFTMGSPANEPGRDSNEVQHQVTVSSFYMGKYEVTQKEYQDVMGTNPSYFKGDNLPVECVSWYDVINYCNRLSLLEGLTPACTVNGKNVTWNSNANGYSLPTEAEWEYACRAGTTTAYNTGTNISDNTGWYLENSDNKTHPVGQKIANAWGLYDMHGNVWELCWNSTYVVQSREDTEYGYSMYLTGGKQDGASSGSAQTDPKGSVSSGSDMARGGSWLSYAQSLRSAHRGRPDPASPSNYTLGFRVVRP